MSTIPFCKLQLTLKQVNLSELTNPGKDVMKHLFGQFEVNTMSAEEKLQASKRVAELFGQTQEKITSEIDGKLSRRYAGDDTLPRGRYYSIANDLSGNDEYTLINELRAYAKPDLLGFFQMYDLTIPKDREYIEKFFAARYNASYHRADVFLIGLLPLYGLSHRLVESWNETDTKDEFPMPMYVEIPLTIKKETIDKVIDLRDPSTANWFLKEISNLEFKRDGKLTKCFSEKPPIKSFRDLIPTLLEQSLGAGWNFCKLAGLYLRQLGANGLIYPSARCDVRVEVTGNKIGSSRGWNFVDYRGAGATTNWAFFDRSTSWPPVVAFSQPMYGDAEKNIYYLDVLINYTENGKNKGSWSVEWLALRQDAWFQAMMIENILKFRGKAFFEKVFPPIDELLRRQPTAGYHFGTANTIVDALRGIPGRLQQLREVTQQLPEKENHIREALVYLVDSTAKIIEETHEKAELENLMPLAILQTSH